VDFSCLASLPPFSILFRCTGEVALRGAVSRSPVNPSTVQWAFAWETAEGRQKEMLTLDRGKK